MKGQLKSRRHNLFMDRKEREQAGIIRTSKLYVLSNPAFMGNSTGERDSEIIHYLIDDVFNLHFHESETRLREIGLNEGFTYATTVLFPEMFLNQHQVGLLFLAPSELLKCRRPLVCMSVGQSVGAK